MGMFEEPSVGGSGIAIRHLANKTCVVLCTGYDPNAEYEGESKPCITIDALVLDEGQMPFGGSAKIGQETPDDQTVKTPYYATGIMTSNGNIVRALRDKAGTGRLTIGRFARSLVGRRPWNLERLDAKDPNTASWNSYGEQMWVSLQNGTFTNPVPVEVFAQPSAAPQTFFTQPSAAPAVAQPTGYVPAVAAPAASGPVRPDAVPESLWNAMDGATRLAVVAASASPLTTQPATSPAPPGVDQAKWDGMTPEEQRQLAALLGGTY